MWEEHSNIDMCGQGDVESIDNWMSAHSIDDLKRIVEEKGYSAFAVSPDQRSFGHAALKKFDFELTEEHCKPTDYSCTIYIYNTSGGRRALDALIVSTNFCQCATAATGGRKPCRPVAALPLAAVPSRSLAAVPGPTPGRSCASMSLSRCSAGFVLISSRCSPSPRSTMRS